MLNVSGLAKVTKVYKKTTANGFQITDLVLEFDTSVCIDKATKQYRIDTIKAFIIGSHAHLPSLNEGSFGTDINLIDAQLRVNTWIDKETGKPKSTPEILINKWELL